MAQIQHLGAPGQGRTAPPGHISGTLSDLVTLQIHRLTCRRLPTIGLLPKSSIFSPNITRSVIGGTSAVMPTMTKAVRIDAVHRERLQLMRY